jgi:large subunit ribosomal protein L35
VKAFSTSSIVRQEAPAAQEPAPSAPTGVEEIIKTKPQWNPEVVVGVRGERTLMQHGVLPVGSRRRRAAVQSSNNIPFEQLPYQAFQEARAILAADRAEKLEKIKDMRERIKRAEEKPVEEYTGGKLQKKNKIDSMHRYLEELKILADINDPMIKKRFEDGEGMFQQPFIAEAGHLN